MEFTIKNYERLLALAKNRFQFVNFYSDFDKSECQMILRHDVDFSPYDALKIAELEAKLNIHSTFFFQVTSIYYSILEVEIKNIIRLISSLGHEIGLHFDLSVYNEKSLSGIKNKFDFEKNILSEISNSQIKIFSLHNPTTIKNIKFDKIKYFNCFNASSPKILEKFKYCSDSNGYWRFESLEELINDNTIQNLYVLIHPVWWQNKEYSPRKKILNTIKLRSKSAIMFYDNLLKTNLRKNIN